jgi:MOSC domain-containing protein YiiM
MTHPGIVAIDDRGALFENVFTQPVTLDQLRIGDIRQTGQIDSFDGR